ncbi:hypothetical protein P7L75_01395 (plasmid) [Tistrella mobilis]|uniref:hypothetical protein n=1 Tax=Tistrella mobilis TaxID=171437 RepID=UPI0035578BB7
MEKSIWKGGWLSGRKTYVAAGLTVIGAAAAYLTGDASLGDALQLAVQGVLTGTLRAGVAKVGR